ncbi:beta-propeller domain-containing protein [Actinomadura decatromicini]|uniref:beta-propeller domain-containing protein n=1 Tax=Actinomadura decatromicini TaxID=2604572 RepID=UPI001FE87EF9|nr:beta-propeller domain-containing protein [Actinomadura decatromicini]
MTALALAGAARCGGSPGGAHRPAPPGPEVRLVAYDGCDALLDGLRRATADKVGPYGLSGVPGMVPLEGDTALRKGPEAAQPGVPNAAPPPGTPQHSTTNSHEPGADEPDLVKTDGRRIVTVTGGELRVIDPATRRVAHTMDLPGLGGAFRGADAQLLLSGDRALVTTQQTAMLPLERRPVPGPGGFDDLPTPTAVPTTRLTLVDLSAAPKVVGTMTTEAAYVDARQTGSTVRVVMRSTPRIQFPGGNGGKGEKHAAEANRAAVLKAPLDAWLPSFRTDDGAGGRAATYRSPCDQVSRPSSYAGSSLLSVLTFDLAKGLGDPKAIAVAADGTTVYGNGKSLYVTGTPPTPYTWNAPPRAPEPRTDVYKFDVAGTERPRYVASGSVKGFLLNQYSLSELDGNLRLATTTSQIDSRERKSESAVYVLAQHGGRLDEIGRLGGLGKGERIYSVRFLGTTAYVVTFRQVDPLYTLDLKDPRRPRLGGELKITGYSAYLHPLADGRLLGVGRDADASGRTLGLQVSLFDVSAAQPRRVASYRLPDASSQAEFEPHAFLYWPQSGLTVIPVTDPGGGTSEALVLKVGGTSITKAGTVRHPDTERFGNGVRRSLVVGNTLWTFSDDGARATDAATLKDAAWLPFK